MIIQFTKTKSQARTLPVSYVTNIKNPQTTKYCRTHDSGWTIFGKVNEDYYSWVNEFIATHEEYGVVSGDFESQVYADSEEGYKHFVENHPVEEWDYDDI